MYMENIGKAIEYCESENQTNGVVNPEMCAADFSNLDEVAFDQGIDRINVVCRKGQRHARMVSAERGEHLTMIAGISAGHNTLTSGSAEEVESF
jgi:hypothetical protein